ncbi:MAG: ATP-dependent helicase [Nitrospirota bacterium]|nr:ATP-dependent helicase [Nitrospirota bacterium]
MNRYKLVPMSPAVRPSATADALLADLNAAQAEAARTTEGPLLVVAGAGTGKTRTLTYRTAFMVANGVAPESILLLTFTRRAAEEMRQRAGVLLDARCDRVQGGTFHATACGLLRQYGQAIGLDPAFTILDRPDAEEVVGMVRAELGLADKKRAFPKKKTLLDIISKAINRDVSMEELLADEYVHFLEHGHAILQAASGYRALKRQRQLVDYDDLLTRMVELLESDPELRIRIGARYRYIMVDEYQDTNRIQARMVRLLAAEHDNVMAVGDDAQSIYRFRGACFRNIMEFPDEFPGCKIVKLTENYRSTPQVLNVANKVMEGASKRYDKELSATREDGILPTLIQAPTENMQSRFICQQIVEMNEEEVQLSEIAVLFRSAFHTFDLEVELARHGLPFVKRGGLKFMETSHLKDLVAYLRLLENPGDAISWSRILKLHPGIGEVSARNIFQYIAQADDPWQGLQTVPAKWAAKLGELAEVLVPLARDADASPARLTERLIEYYTPQLETHYDDHPKRSRDMDQLIALAERYDRLGSFLTDLALEPPEASVAGAERMEDKDHLILSTIHSAKGLEWQAVFVIWAVDGRFPSAYAEGSQDDLDEERRLMYVAATRARDRLTITYPVGVYDRATGLVLSRPSRFVEDIPADLLEPWALSDETERALPGAVEEDGFDHYFRQDDGW